LRLQSSKDRTKFGRAPASIQWIYVNDHLNLNAASEWHLRHTYGAAGMGSAVTKNFKQQFRSAIGNYVRFGKMRRAVYKDDQFHDTPHVVQVTDGFV
jgi:hypothetical protein